MNERRWYIVQTYSGYENSVQQDLKKRIETMGQQDYIFNVLVPEEQYIEDMSSCPQWEKFEEVKEFCYNDFGERIYHDELNVNIKY